jgi:hypothetical protein
MSTQEYINILLGIVSFFGGWLLKEVWSSLKDLQKADKETTAKISSMEITMTSDYVKKTEMESVLKSILSKLEKLENLELLIVDKYAKKEDVGKLGEAIFKKLDSIENKLDRKVDKEGFNG